MSSINFLPDQESKEKNDQKIRTIEYTSPEEKAKKSKSSSHGGVLSIFKKKDLKEEKPVELPPLPPKPGEQKKQEPTVRSHDDKKKPVEKTVIAYQKPVSKKEQVKKDEKDGNWFTRLFQKKEKFARVGENQGAQLPPPPPAPPTETDNTESKKEVAHETPAQDLHRSTKQNKTTVEDTPSASPLPPPPVFNAFKEEEEKPVPEAKKETLGPPPPPTKPQQVPEIPVEAEEPEQELQKPTQEFTDIHEAPIPRPRGMGFEVNLVPDELVQRKQTMSRLTMLAVVVVSTVFVCGVVYGILAFYKSNVAQNVTSTREEISKVQNQIDALTPIQRDALVLQKRTEEISRLLDSQIHWVRFFEELETYTHTGVKIKRVSVDEEGSVTLDAEAIDLATAYEQIDVFRNATDFVSTLDVTKNPTLPQKSTSSSGGISISGITVTSPDSAAPGETEIPTSPFSLTLILVPDLLTSK